MVNRLKADALKRAERLKKLPEVMNDFKDGKSLETLSGFHWMSPLVIKRMLIDSLGEEEYLRIHQANIIARCRRKRPYLYTD